MICCNSMKIRRQRPVVHWHQERAIRCKVNFKRNSMDSRPVSFEFRFCLIRVACEDVSGGLGSLDSGEKDRPERLHRYFLVGVTPGRKQ